MLNATNKTRGSYIPLGLYFPSDAIIMEYNSRDYIPRMHIANHRAEVLVGFLRRKIEEGKSTVGKGPGSDAGVIKHVMYSDSQTPENYDLCRRRSPISPSKYFPASESIALPSDAPFILSHLKSHMKNGTEAAHKPGYGPLLSIIFHTPLQARIFYDALKSPKGPSFGTPFSMTFPYVLIVYGSHAGDVEDGAEDTGNAVGKLQKQDLQWAMERGFEEGFIRMCVGWEDEAKDEVDEVRGEEEDGMELVREVERALRVVEERMKAQSQ